MTAYRTLQNIREDATFLLSLLRDHEVFHYVAVLREKKQALMGNVPLLLRKTEPSTAFLSADFLLHRFFVGLSSLSVDDYEVLVAEFFDGANLGVLEALTVVYLQNAASLSRVDERRAAFLGRREMVGQMGMRFPAADECSKLFKEEAECCDDGAMPELAKKSAATMAGDASPAPIVLSNAPEGAMAPRAFAPAPLASSVPSGSRFRTVILSVLAVVFVGLAFASFGDSDLGFRSDRNRPAHTDTVPASEKPGVGGSGIDPGNAVKSELKGSSNDSDISFAWLTWPFWRDYFGLHSREIFITIMSGVGVMITGIFLGLKDALRNGVVRLCGGIWWILSMLPKWLWSLVSVRMYRAAMSSSDRGAEIFWMGYLRVFHGSTSAVLMSLVGALSREIREFGKMNDDEETVRNRIIEEAKKALDQLRKERG